MSEAHCTQTGMRFEPFFKSKNDPRKEFPAAKPGVAGFTRYPRYA